jgi:hypothetical protein
MLSDIIRSDTILSDIIRIAIHVEGHFPQLCYAVHCSIKCGYAQYCSSVFCCAECCYSECPGNTKGGSITVPLTSCLTGLESAV